MVAIATVSFPPPTLTSLPTEIVDQICGHLDQPSLAACALAARSWNTLCTPYLWATVHIELAASLGPFITIDAQRALFRNTPHIRSLSLWYEAVFNIFDSALNAAPVVYGPLSREHHGFQACIHLRRLEFGLHFYSSLTSPKTPCFRMDRTMVQLIRQNPGLKELLIYRPFFPYRILSLLMHDLPNLEVLDLGSEATTIDQGFAKVLLAHLPESIRSVLLYVRHGGSVKVGSRAALLRDTLAYTGPPRQHLQLESLSLKGNFDTPASYKFLLSFLKTCSTKFRTFNTPGIYWVYHRQIRKRLNRLGMFLQTLDIRRDFLYRQDMGDARTAEYIRFSPQWREIYIERWRELGPLAAAAIGDTCEYLVSLQLMGCSGIESAQIRLILGKAVQLKTFNVLSLSSNTTPDPFITAADMARLEWGSLSLEEFKCKIEVPRPDSCDENMQESSASSPPGLKSFSEAMGASRALQRQVYLKLAELPLLRTLSLGATDFTSVPQSSPYQKQCLEWSLESGLEALAEGQGFQSLQCLSVCAMAHRISIAELEWMNRSWPKLERLEGMFSRCANPMPGAREWMTDHRPEWTTSADLKWFATGTY